MKELLHVTASAASVSERVLRDWAIGQEIQDRTHHLNEEKLGPPRVKPYISISRETGAGAYEIACGVGCKLGWAVLGKNLLDWMAERFHDSRILLEYVDETEGSWVYDVLGTWLDRNLISHQKFVSQLACALYAATIREHCIIVGRGAQFVLPRKRGLAVRLVASMAFRVQRIMRQRGLAESEARRLIEATDRGRRDFVQRFFHHDLDDPHLYDLEVNVERVGFDRAVEMIAAARPE